MNWFTGDYHFNHKAIIQFCNRPFLTMLEMNRVIIQRHNERVAPSDTVYFLGDFAFYTSKYEIEMFLKRLNGHFVFIQGNHDKNNNLNAITKYSVLNTYGKQIQLVHKPDDIVEGFDLYLCGHVHEKWKFKKVFRGQHPYSTYVVNVGVDAWGFYPVNMKQILKALKKWGENDKSNQRM